MQLSINTKITGRLFISAGESRTDKLRKPLYDAMRPFFRFIADPNSQDDVRLSTPLYSSATGMGNNTIAYRRLLQ